MPLALGRSGMNYYNLGDYSQKISTNSEDVQL